MKCSRCHAPKVADDFKTCDKCRAEKRQYRANNREQLAGYMREYRAEKSQERSRTLWAKARQGTMNAAETAQFMRLQTSALDWW